MFIEKLRKSKGLQDFLGDYAEDFLKESEIVQETLLSQMFESLSMNYESIDRCESPIEKTMFLTLKDLISYNNRWGWQASLATQVEVKVGNKKYRTDIWLKNIDTFGREINLVIECDGHDFHEKTKEQAAKDKKRDRDFTSLGLKVLRFTGSEIYKDPEECAWEVIQIVRELSKLEETKNIN